MALTEAIRQFLGGSSRHQIFKCVDNQCADEDTTCIDGDGSYEDVKLRNAVKFFADLACAMRGATLLLLLEVCYKVKMSRKRRGRVEARMVVCVQQLRKVGDVSC